MNLKGLNEENVGKGIYEGTGKTNLEGMVPIKGVHPQCNEIFALALRRICGDYIENKCEIIPEGIDEEVNTLTQKVLNNKCLMSTLNEVMEKCYLSMVEESVAEDIERAEPKENGVQTMRAFDE